MASSKEDVVRCLLKSFDEGKRNDEPYTHWNLIHCMPEDVLDEILALPLEAPDLEGVSGKRELHNKTRTYFDVENRKRFPCCAALAEALQDKRVTGRVAQHFGTDLEGTYLRIEYAQDTGGFWLEPHSDLGVKNFTMLVYLSKDPSHKELGTDIYDADKKHVGRSPFEPNGALVFIPADDTFHGFEPRTIEGVRKSIIINYVTDEWRAREQLAFPDAPISS
ncbi:MAG TPA: 2OG-Fe(II) oxygenase [Rhizobiales bacterium]|nr:hypothetical protein BMS3Bbin10_02450 [bacterium BMS3Bbin10]HDO51299.1 2OG-Fe(II) oxygenase [Hyphomicrobiales bacterium]